MSRKAPAGFTRAKQWVEMRFCNLLSVKVVPCLGTYPVVFLGIKAWSLNNSSWRTTYLKLFPLHCPLLSVILTKMDLTFSCHLSFEALPSTAWAQGTVDTRGEVGGLLWARKVMSYFEFIIEQTQQWGEGRSNYFGPSWLWQCLPTSWCSRAAPALCKVHQFASTERSMTSVWYAVRCHRWLATAAVINNR